MKLFHCKYTTTANCLFMLSENKSLFPSRHSTTNWKSSFTFASLPPLTLKKLEIFWKIPKSHLYVKNDDLG